MLKPKYRTWSGPVVITREGSILRLTRHFQRDTPFNRPPPISFTVQESEVPAVIKRLADLIGKRVVLYEEDEE